MDINRSTPESQVPRVASRCVRAEYPHLARKIPARHVREARTSYIRLQDPTNTRVAD